MKRTRRGASSAARQASPDSTDELHIPEWQRYLSDELRSQWNKLHNSQITVQSKSDAFDRTIFSNWHYQYTIAWLYKVCDSFVTISYADNLDSVSFKPMWRDFKFDELPLLEDLSNTMKFSTDDEYYHNYEGNDYNDDDEDNSNEIDTQPLSVKVRLHLLRTLANNKSLQLKDWDTVVNHYLSNENTIFNKLDLVEQFEELYKVIKMIETKSLTFRNYLSTHLSLFEFYEFVIGDGLSIVALPNVGVLVEKRLVRQHGERDLVVPLKLKNCTISYEDKENDTKEIVHIDYSNDIDSYLKSFKMEFTILTHDWESFLEKSSSDPDLVNFHELIPIYAEHQLYTRRMLLQREKERSMAQLLTRRKRSSRLVAREEETKRKQLENAWYEKLDEREQFIKNRTRLVTKQMKKYKDHLWNQLWSRFEQDLKVLKIQRRNESADHIPDSDNVHEHVDESDVLSPLELEVISKGPRFTESILKAPAPQQAPVEGSQEIPRDLLITQNELDELANYGISTNHESVDEAAWVFQDPAEPGVPPFKIENSEDEELHTDRLRDPIICCDLCLKWQPWESNQTQELVDLRNLDNRHSAEQLLTQRDYGVVQLGGHGSRRSVRKHAQTHDPEYVRPTDKRKPLGETNVFICAWCLAKEEDRLREQFLPELKNSRIQARRRLEEREKRLKLKEQKRQQALQARQQAHQAHQGAAAIRSGHADIQAAAIAARAHIQPAYDAQPFQTPQTSQPAQPHPVLQSQPLPQQQPSFHAQPHSQPQSYPGSQPVPPSLHQSREQPHLEAHFEAHVPTQKLPEPHRQAQSHPPRPPTHPNLPQTESGHVDTLPSHLQLDSN